MPQKNTGTLRPGKYNGLILFTLQEIPKIGPLIIIIIKIKKTVKHIVSLAIKLQWGLLDNFYNRESWGAILKFNY